MFVLVEEDTATSIQQNIGIILSTPKGSDPHRPDFGSDINKYIDRPINAITEGQIKAEIVDAIELWEPRVKVQAIDLVKDISKVTINLTWTIIETGQIDTAGFSI